MFSSCACGGWLDDLASGWCLVRCLVCLCGEKFLWLLYFVCCRVVVVVVEFCVLKSNSIQDLSHKVVAG